MESKVLIGGQYYAKIAYCHSAKYTGHMIMSGMAPISVEGKTREAAELALHVFIYGDEIGNRKFSEGMNG